MLEVGQRVLHTRLNVNGVVESADENKIIIRFNDRYGKKGPYRSVYSPLWVAENPRSIQALPFTSPSYYAEDIAELEEG